MNYVREAIEFVTTRRIEILKGEQERKLSGQRINAERMRNFEKFRCQDCRLPHAQQFMVHDEVWALAKFPQEASVCFRCFVSAMPRPLVIEDFKHCLTNEMIFRAYEMGVNMAVQHEPA